MKSYVVPKKSDRQGNAQLEDRVGLKVISGISFVRGAVNGQHSLVRVIDYDDRSQQEERIQDPVDC